MKPRLTLLFALTITGLLTMGQRTAIELTFMAVNNTAHAQMDSIRIMNHTQGGETMIYWPDTTLSLEINQGDLLLYVGYATFTVGVQEMNNEVSSFAVYQNYPNPIEDQSEISMYIPHKGIVNVMITDLQGRVVLRTDQQLNGGHHSFRFAPCSSNLYFLTAHWNGISRSIKMISPGPNDGKSCRLDYVGSTTGEAVLKTFLQAHDFLVRESGILDSPEESQTYTFQFATNIPCPGTSTVEYEGQVYNTIQIFSQCWLKENLNVGTMIPGDQEMMDNGVIEKYCYDNNTDSCTKYGGLYQWNEMMQYTTQQGTQGICPPGWHIPSDEEWKVLEGAMDSQYGIGDPEWDISSELYWRGFDAGTNLKATNGWNYNGNGPDLFGFSGLPGGYRDISGGFYDFGYNGNWWTSTEDSDYGGNMWYHRLYYDRPVVGRHSYGGLKGNGFSVRCLKDY